MSDHKKRIIELEQQVKQLLTELKRIPTLEIAETRSDEESGQLVVGSWEEAYRLFNQALQTAEMKQLFDFYCDSVGVPFAIIDIQGNILASSRWQRICTDFHRVHKVTYQRCIESDTQLALKLQAGKDYSIYRCKNGMTDCASPIIIEGHHVANVFIGQFLLKPPDMDFFREQARLYGFDESEYFAALKDVSIVDEQKVPNILGFLSRFAHLVGVLSMERIRSKQANAKLKEYQAHLEELVNQRTEELRRQTTFIQAVLENIADGIVACNETGTLSLFNRATREIHGIDQEDLPPEEWGEHYNLYLADGTTPMKKEQIPLFRVFQGEHLKNTEMVIIPDGRPAHIVLVSGQPLYDESGNKIGGVTSMHDITEQKHAEGEMLKAKERAESANRAKSEFLANMSHEIRTPMNAVLGFTEILKGMETDEKKKHFLNSIYTSGIALLSLINDILDLSKIEAGKLNLQYSATSIQSMLEEMRTLFTQKITEKGLSFNIQCADNIPSSLVVDQSRLRQILLNLLSNATKFTTTGGIELHAYSEDVNHGNINQVNLMLTVIDTGIGISPENQQKIFDAFEQASGQKQNQYGGTGLGLAITRRLVEMMDGTISVQSEEGKGSTFTVFLPGVETASIGELRASQIQAFDTSHIHFKPATILIADDLDYNREMLRIFLNEWDFTIVEAVNGQGVLELVKTYHPNLILLDMKMPVMDGYEVARKLSLDESLKDISIIAVTASALKKDEAVVSQLCDGYLRKPVSKFELVSELMKFLPYTIEEVLQTVEINEVDASIVYPPAEKMAQLYDLAMRGNITEIKTFISQLKTKMPECISFTEQLEQLLSSLNYETIVKIVEQSLKMELSK